MSDEYVEPDDSIRKELVVAVKQIFAQHFEESNIHPQPLSISCEFKRGEWSAEVDLNWQRKSDFEFGRTLASFKYIRRTSSTSREMYWYCSSGLPNN